MHLAHKTIHAKTSMLCWLCHCTHINAVHLYISYMLTSISLAGSTIPSNLKAVKLGSLFRMAVTQDWDTSHPAHTDTGSSWQDIARPIVSLQSLFQWWQSLCLYYIEVCKWRYMEVWNTHMYIHIHAHTQSTQHTCMHTHTHTHAHTHTQDDDMYTPETTRIYTSCFACPIYKKALLWWIS